MAIASATLRRLVWITAPATLFFALQGIREWNQGSAWNAAAYALMAVLVVAVGSIARGRVLPGRLAIAWLGVLGVGIAGWLAAPDTSLRVVGFIIAVAAQIAVAVAARRVGTEPTPLRNDSTIESGISELRTR